METKQPKPLTEKAQAAWQLILASGQEWVKYYSAGGAILADGTKIHSHTISSLRGHGYLKAVTMDENGQPIDAVRGWHFIVNRTPEAQAVAKAAYWGR